MRPNWGIGLILGPLFLFQYGREGIAFTDWRVILCFGVPYGVPLIYMMLGGRVMQAAWKRGRERSVVGLH